MYTNSSSIGGGGGGCCYGNSCLKIHFSLFTYIHLISSHIPDNMGADKAGRAVTHKTSNIFSRKGK